MTIAEEIAKITKANGGSTKNSTTILGAVQDLVKSKGGSNADTGNIADAVKQYGKVEGGGSSNQLLNVFGLNFSVYIPVRDFPEFSVLETDDTVGSICDIAPYESTDPNYDVVWNVELNQTEWMVPFPDEEDDVYYMFFVASSTIEADNETTDDDGFPYNVYWFDDNYSGRNMLQVFEAAIEWPQICRIRSSSGNFNVMHVRYKGIDGSTLSKDISLNVTFNQWSE